MICWLGRTDLFASQGKSESGRGPIAQALDYAKLSYLESSCFSKLILLSNYSTDEENKYLDWLIPQFPNLNVDLLHVQLSSPTAYSEIYTHAKRTLDELTVGKLDEHFTFHLSPGTPAMAAVWIILAKTLYPATLIESSKEHGVRVVDFPFELSAEFLPDSIRKHDERLEQLSALASSCSGLCRYSAPLRTHAACAAQSP